MASNVNVHPFTLPGQISRVFGNGPITDDLSAGVQASFGVIGYKGKVWSIKHRGEEVQLLRQDGDGARNSIEVVILAAAKNLAKIFYASGYTEGANAAPDCFSTDGIVPSPSAASKQSPTCGSCPHNVWGSSISAVSGKPTKRCADNKRMAVVPLADISNEIYGGPMLIRVPAASLQEMAQYGQKMQQLGYPSYSIGTRISFDTEVSYPRFVFQAIRPLTDDEAVKVLELKNSSAVARILAEASELTSAPVVNASELERAFEQPPKVKDAPKVEAPKVEDNTWPTPSQTQKTNPALTGQVSTTSAQPAVPVPTVSSVPLEVSAPATVSPQQPQAVSNPPAGGATTVNTEPKSGFGYTAPAIPVAPTPAEEVSPTTPEDNSFEAGLDVMMAKLLPAGSQ